MARGAARRRWSLTRYFGVVSFVAMSALGFALVWMTGRVMHEQSVGDGTQSASSVMAYAAAPLPPEAFDIAVLSDSEREAVSSATSLFSSRLVGLRLWSTAGALMYSSTDETVGFPDTERLAQVLATGEPDARVLDDVSQVDASAPGATVTEVLDVYVPVRESDARDLAGSVIGTPLPTPSPGTDEDPVIGAAEVVLDHTEAVKTLAQARGTVTLVVAGGLVALWVLLFRTVHATSKRLQASAMENARLALLDSLTGLPNRRLLADRMRRDVAEALRSGGRVGLVLLDIDRFKDINDSLGHDHGDELLEQVAERLRGALRDEDVVARLGGDEFAVLLPDVRSVANAERLARRVRQLFIPPFQLGEMSLHVETSVGVACIPDHASDASSLMRTADVAMYSAKHHRTGVAVYDPDEDHSSPQRLVLLGDLHQAIEAPVGDSELVMHYQPKVALETGRPVGYEALMRWDHPTRGLLLPGAFIPLAEQSGLIHDLTRFALTSAITQLARWREAGTPLPVAVNLSAHDVTTTAVVDSIERLLTEHDVPAELLEVEITETALVADPSRIVPVLERLGALGVHVAIDDFGIGNTSISQLRDLPVGELKIDRLFVADLRSGDGERSEVVVQAMVDLAHSFGLRVVAEGVEDEDTAATLRRLGVDRAQGFLYSPAVPPEDVPAPLGPGRERGTRASRVRGVRGA
ncbi:putative bifunctional diguanylate cyclase/phosphodiesterase [Cellulomonas palmilytica]|uniref:putative bifunctional diguanylate cyclase/phosphodiesterase n=1 Tax=Cellulomonas palmilytica TaxID=2608402 RepID=UPI001F2932F9|nr:EAL domain-containing protein [Cellulomonas palmilytica]UJP39976.1 EAL domain-containing protein [Cellulomonas palmilytica]